MIFLFYSILGLILAVWLAMSPFYWRLKGVPSLIPLPLLGNSLKAFSCTMMDFVKYIYDLYPDAPYIGVHFFTRPTLFIRDPEIISDVLLKDHDSFNSRGFYGNKARDPCSDNLFFASEDRWKDVRSKMTPLYTLSKVRSMVNPVTRTINKVKDFIDQHAKVEKEFNAHPLMMQLSTDAGIAVTFGVETDVFEKDSVFTKMEKKMFDPLLTIRLFCGMVSRGFYDLMKFSFLPSDVIDFYRRLTKDAIELRMKSKSASGDFIQTLVNTVRSDEQNSDVDMNEAAARAIVLVAAGVETSGLSLSFVFYELAANLDIQEKARNEIIKLKCQLNREITYEDLSQLTYISMIISESLRKYSPLASITRESTKDYTFRTGVKIPRGTWITVPVQGIHHDPKYYPNPEVFDPERFSEDNKKSRPPGVYLAFGYGPKICLGMKFAQMEMMFALVQLLPEYKFTLSPNMKVPIEISRYHFVTTPKNGVWLKANKIK